jgi:hypothetical protein
VALSAVVAYQICEWFFGADTFKKNEPGGEDDD